MLRWIQYQIILGQLKTKIEGRTFKTICTKQLEIFSSPLFKYLKSLCKLYSELFLAFVWITWAFLWQPVTCNDYDAFPKHVLFNFMPLCKCLTVPLALSLHVKHLNIFPFTDNWDTVKSQFFSITLFVLPHLQNANTGARIPCDSVQSWALS